MTNRKKLTNEELTRQFKNPFELVNHAIKLAKHLVESGHELSELGDKNAASIVLKRVLKEKEDEEKNLELIQFENEETLSDDKELPNPLLQAI
ncbi:MAG: hypothetical protein S4CHLAM7_06380 [Chlamydiae bacterium]|nr:hypothetical protein [Chlamydiota bacterium]